jgi:hypothetical protein
MSTSSIVRCDRLPDHVGHGKSNARGRVVPENSKHLIRRARRAGVARDSGGGCSKFHRTGHITTVTDTMLKAAAVGGDGGLTTHPNAQQTGRPARIITAWSCNIGVVAAARRLLTLGLPPVALTYRLKGRQAMGETRWELDRDFREAAPNRSSAPYWRRGVDWILRTSIRRSVTACALAWITLCDHLLFLMAGEAADMVSGSLTGVLAWSALV